MSREFESRKETLLQKQSNWRSRTRHVKQKSRIGSNQTLQLKIRDTKEKILKPYQSFQGL